MNKELYENLATEQQYNIIKTYLDLVYDAVSKRMEMLPAVSALAATLLVVATFNQDLIELNNFVRGLVSILLMIIPISLIAYNRDLKNAQMKNQKVLENLLGADLTLKNVSKLDKIITWMPDLLIYIISFVIICAVFAIWKSVILI